MKIRIKAVSLIFSVIISGCSIYRDYSFEYFERSGPKNRMEFKMEDGTIHNIESNQIAMMKNSRDFYTIYFKNDQKLVLRKDEVTSVKMLDEARTATLNIAIFTIVGVLVTLGTIWMVFSFFEH